MVEIVILQNSFSKDLCFWRTYFLFCIKLASTHCVPVVTSLYLLRLLLWKSSLGTWIVCTGQVMTYFK